MKNIPQFLNRAGYLLIVLALGSLSFAELKIGDNAPDLRTDRWLKGTPVKGFKRGNVYVLEFWATWCGPCKAAMPHLTELAKTYGDKATFVGVNIWEDSHAKPGENLDAKVDRFMAESGSMMGYNVCAGSKDGYMVKSWMNAAGQAGIPATFVVDQDGKVAWIGHPLNLEEPLKQIIAGKFDRGAYRKEFEAKQQASSAAMKPLQDAMKPVTDAMAAKKYDEAIAAAESGMTKLPQYGFVLAGLKFQALYAKNPELAYQEAQKVVDDWNQGYGVMETFLMKDDLDKKFYQVALEIAQNQYKQKPQVSSRLALIAMAYHKLGDASKAVEYQQRFIDTFKPSKDNQVILQELRKTLEEYRSKKS